MVVFASQRVYAIWNRNSALFRLILALAVVPVVTTVVRDVSRIIIADFRLLMDGCLQITAFYTTYRAVKVPAEARMCVSTMHLQRDEILM